MKYLSVCSGIEAASVAWHPLGWEAVGYSEIEPFPSAVLAHHYPNVPNVGDMTKFKEWNLEKPIDLLVGGTPCQSFSVAGLRKGLEDPRGNLALVYCGILDHFRPQWFVWENVPGVLSSNGGRDFGSFLGALAELGYGFAYRVLDAQYFGMAQRRRRVFVVGYLGNWRRAAEVLFESESVCRNPAPSREARQETAKCLTAGVGKRYDFETETLPVAFDWQSGGDLRGLDPKDTAMLQRSQVPAVTQPTYGIPGNWIGRQPENGGNAVEPMHDVSPCLTKTDRHGVAQPYVGGVDYENNAHTMDEPTGPLLKGSPTGGGRPLPAIATAMQVRRLTPVECERLQGFPDNYTNIPWRKSAESPDGPRYKALGNSMAVPVMRWIGERINKMEQR
jgi:DNA (cytosine-5)-methyltransferase 1